MEGHTAEVVLLRGVNVGGRRRFQPSRVAQALAAYDVTSIGAAGTFIVHKPPDRATLRTMLAWHLPFEAEIMICRGSDLARLVSDDPFADRPTEPDLVSFVGVLGRRPSAAPRRRGIFHRPVGRF